MLGATGEGMSTLPPPKHDSPVEKNRAVIVRWRTAVVCDGEHGFLDICISPTPGRKMLDIATQEIFGSGNEKIRFPAMMRRLSQMPGRDACVLTPALGGLVDAANYSVLVSSLCACILRDES